jgi:hypothetical protein
MAGAANASAIDVQEFYTTLSYVGPVAANLGISLEDVSGTIGVLGNNAIKGSKAGTGLRQFLMRLQPASDKAEEAMRSLGLITKEGGNQFYDASGKMKSMSDIVSILKNSLNGLTDADRQDKLKTIFGLIASPTVNTLVNENTSAIEDMKDAIGKVTAEEVAARQMDNFAGTVEKVQSTIEAIAIKIGDMFIPILNYLGKVLNNVLGYIARLPSPILAIGVAIALVVAAVGPLITIFGTLVIFIGMVVSAVAAIGSAIAAVSIPIIVAVIASLAIEFFWLGVAIGSVAAYILWFVNSIIPIMDTLRLLKNLISGDLKGSLNVLINKFGMSKKAANELMNRLLDLKDKAYQLWVVLSDSLSTIFEIIGDNILKALGKFDLFNNSTEDTKNNTINTFNAILKPIESLINYLYKLADAFGLIPAEVKFANDKTAAEYVKLNAVAEKSYNQLYNLQKSFAGTYTKENAEMYNKALADTKKAFDNEYKLAEQQLNKKRDMSIKGAQEQYKNTKVLTETEEKARIDKINQYYEKEKADLRDKNTKILEMYQIAINEKRELTQQELMQIDNLRQASENKNLQLITESRNKQKVILEQARMQTMALTKQESLEIVVEANNKYNQVIAAAKKEKDDKIANAIFERDTIGSLNKQQTQDVITEALTQYRNTVNSATLTKDDTLRIAQEKSGGLLTQEDLLKTNMGAKNAELKAKINEIWGLIKSDVLKIMDEIITALLDKIDKRLSSGVQTSLAGVAAKFTAGIASFTGGGLALSLLGLSSSGGSKTKKHALGTRYSLGGMALVGEAGAELVNLPRGSQVYNNSQTKSIMNNSSSRSINISYTGNVGINDKNRFTNMLRMAGVY